MNTRVGFTGLPRERLPDHHAAHRQLGVGALPVGDRGGEAQRRIRGIVGDVECDVQVLGVASRGELNRIAFFKQ